MVPAFLPRGWVRNACVARAQLLKDARFDFGWDVFYLDYAVQAPISAVISPSAMAQYYRVFNFLWRLKRVEYGLSSVWKQHSIAEHSLRVRYPAVGAYADWAH